MSAAASLYIVWALGILLTVLFAWEGKVIVVPVAALMLQGAWWLADDPVINDSVWAEMEEESRKWERGARP